MVHQHAPSGCKLIFASGNDAEQAEVGFEQATEHVDVGHVPTDGGVARDGILKVDRAGIPGAVDALLIEQVAQVLGEELGHLNHLWAGARANSVGRNADAHASSRAPLLRGLRGRLTNSEGGGADTQHWLCDARAPLIHALTRC